MAAMAGRPAAQAEAGSGAVSNTEYLVGIPNLGDCLEDAAAQLGMSIAEYELNRL